MYIRLALAGLARVVAFKSRAYDLCEMIPGFFVGIVMTMVVGRLTPSRRKAV